MTIYLILFILSLFIVAICILKKWEPVAIPFVFVATLMFILCLLVPIDKYTTREIVKNAEILKTKDSVVIIVDNQPVRYQETKYFLAPSLLVQKETIRSTFGVKATSYKLLIGE